MPANVSVIVPVYRVEEYLPRCLRSLAEQTILRDIEILLIDDGSPDRSGAIADEFAEKHENARVIHKQNGGLSSARNAGIDIATGEFLMFLDSDDFLRADACEQAYRAAVETGADIVSFSVCPVFDDEVKPVKLGHAARMLRGGGDIFGALVNTRGSIQEIACDKLYRRQLFDGLRFPPGRRHEDAFLMPHIFRRAEALYVLPEALYFYRQRPGSIMHTRGDTSVDDRIAAHEEILHVAREQFPEHAEAARARVYHIRIVCLNFILDCPRFRRHPCWKAHIRALRRALPDLLRTQSRKWLPPRRKAYAVLLALCPDLALVYERIRFRKRRRVLEYVPPDPLRRPRCVPEHEPEGDGRAAARREKRPQGHR